MSLSSETPGAEPDGAPSEPLRDRPVEPIPAIERIAASIADLEALAERPLAEHADAYQRVHGLLQGELAEIDGNAERS